MQTIVRVLQGLDTIGGNIVAFEREDSRVVMDFGTTFVPTDDDTQSLLTERKLPNIPEFFLSEVKGHFTHNAIFISHLHIDHMGALQYLDDTVDVYMSPEAMQLYLTLQSLNSEPKTKANLMPIYPETPIQIGGLTVTAYLSDHDTIGAYMFRVQDGIHEFVHSGDVRYDGPHSERVDYWTKILHDNQPDLFFIEGTEFSFENKRQHRETEASLLLDFEKVLQQTNELVVINPYQRNIERLFSLQMMAHKMGRELVWDHEFATILKNQAAKHVHEIAVDVSWSEIEQKPNKYVVQNSFNDLNDLNKMNSFVYLHMNGEPLGDYDDRYAILEDYLTARNIPLQLMGASGHATETDLLKIAVAVNAKLTVPWHSFKPELEKRALQKLGLKTYLPHLDEPMIFKD